MIDLVMVHAFPFDGRLWQQLAQDLGPQFRVHAPDLPGFGRSTTPAVDSVDAMADAVRRYVDSTGLTHFALGGLSMGGYVTQAYWRQHADRRPAAVVLACTRAEGDAPEMRKVRDLTAVQLRSEGNLNAYAERMRPNLLAADASSAVVDMMRTWICEQPLETVLQAVTALRDRHDERLTMPSVTVPALVLAGERDVITPPAVLQSMAALLPQARYVEIPGAGHLANLDRPATFADAVRRFLEPLG